MSTKTPFTIEEMISIPRLSSPAISEDGGQAAWVAHLALCCLPRRDSGPAPGGPHPNLKDGEKTGKTRKGHPLEEGGLFCNVFNVSTQGRRTSKFLCPSRQQKAYLRPR